VKDEKNVKEYPFSSTKITWKGFYLKTKDKHCFEFHFLTKKNKSKKYLCGMENEAEALKIYEKIINEVS